MSRPLFLFTLQDGARRVLLLPLSREGKGREGRDKTATHLDCVSFSLSLSLFSLFTLSLQSLPLSLFTIWDWIGSARGVPLLPSRVKRERERRDKSLQLSLSFQSLSLVLSTLSLSPFVPLHPLSLSSSTGVNRFGFFRSGGGGVDITPVFFFYVLVFFVVEVR